MSSFSTIRAACLHVLIPFWSLPVVVLFPSSTLVNAQTKEPYDPYSLVDPRVGTANDGLTFPSVGVPFAMTGWTPETRSTEEKCVAPYYDKDTRITGFRGSHFLSGGCSQEYGSVSVMPTVGPLKVSAQARASAFRRESEIMAPASYSVFLNDYQTKVEITGTKRSGVMRMTFPAGRPANLLVQPNAKVGEGFVQVRPDAHEIVGYNPVHRIYSGEGQPAGLSGYFVVRFREPIISHGIWCGEDIAVDRDIQEGGCKTLGAFVTLQTTTVTPIIVKIGTSFTSLEEAEKNLDAEISDWDFDSTRSKAEKAWRGLLQRIELEGGTPAQQRIFYTALYHASLDPRIVSDADGTYNGFDHEGRLHKAVGGTDEYDDFSLWDTFRALHPLLTILDPQREEQMVQSLIDKGSQGGYLPIFPFWNNYTAEMIGDHAGAVIFDAYIKGLRHFDVPEAYRLIRKNAMDVPSHDDYLHGKGRRGIESYLRYGYIPLEDEVLDAYHKREQVSRTLEYAYDDWIAGKFAEQLGHTDDAKTLLARSGNWKNVFDQAVGFVRGRHADGSWITPFNPAKSAPFVTEGVPWQYTFFVPQDLPGLSKAMGGNSKFVEKLDGLFAANLYEQGNEPSHAIAFLYNYVGASWKTQAHVRAILSSQFREGAGGLPGNDDSGQMSAWYVLSAMGFYPVQPGNPTYALSSPLFSKVVIHQNNGKDFTIRASRTSAPNIYIQSARLNGKEFHGHEITHADIVDGGTLTLEMGSTPNVDAIR